MSSQNRDNPQDEFPVSSNEIEKRIRSSKNLPKYDPVVAIKVLEMFPFSDPMTFEIISSNEEKNLVLKHSSLDILRDSDQIFRVKGGRVKYIRNLHQDKHTNKVITSQYTYVLNSFPF